MLKTSMSWKSTWIYSKSSFAIWKFDINLKKFYPIWIFFQNINPALQRGAKWVDSTLSRDNFEYMHMAPLRKGSCLKLVFSLDNFFFRFELNFQI